MYNWKLTKDETKELLKDIKMQDFAEKVGVTNVTLSYILNQKRGCSKLLAYCITKSIDEEKEINDFFTMNKVV